MKDNRLLQPGEQFNNWTIIQEVKRPNQDSRHYLARCKCGGEYTLNTSSLKHGKSKQCRRCSFHKHGMARTPTYHIWSGILTRCHNPNDKVYKWYGARGITVCDRWLKFENFYEDMGERPGKFELDRIDSYGNYEPSNCRWVSKLDNIRNRRPLPDLLSGKAFGKWQIIKRVEHFIKEHWYYLCRCECGLEAVRIGSQIAAGESKSCRPCSAMTRRNKSYNKKKALNEAKC